MSESVLAGSSLKRNQRGGATFAGQVSKALERGKLCTRGSFSLLPRETGGGVAGALRQPQFLHLPTAPSPVRSMLLYVHRDRTDHGPICIIYRSMVRTVRDGEPRMAIAKSFAQHLSSGSKDHHSLCVC